MSKPDKKKFNNPKDKNKGKTEEEEQAEEIKPLNEEEEVIEPFNKDEVRVIKEKPKLNTFLQGFVAMKFVTMNIETELLHIIEKELAPPQKDIREKIENGKIRVPIEAQDIKTIIENAEKKRKPLNLEQLLYLEHASDDQKLLKDLEAKLSQVKELVTLLEKTKSFNYDKYSVIEKTRLAERIKRSKKEQEIIENKIKYLKKFVEINKDGNTQKLKRIPETLAANRRSFLSNFKEETEKIAEKITKWEELRQASIQRIEAVTKANEEAREKFLEQQQEEKNAKLEKLQEQHDELHEKYKKKMEEMKEEIQSLEIQKLDKAPEDYLYFKKKTTR